MQARRIHPLIITTLVPIATALGACNHDEIAADREAHSNATLAEASDRPEGPCPEAARQPDPSEVVDMPVGDSPVRGSDAAKVTIVVACDFECRYCKQVQPTLDRVRDTYGDSVRLVFKHNPLPFHEQAVSAALAAEAAREQGKFWEMHDLLLVNQQQLGEPQYLAWAEQLGLDAERFRSDLHSAALRKRIGADQKLVRSLGGKGTPSFWVNGRFLNGAQPFPRLNRLVFDLLADRDTAAADDPPVETTAPKGGDCGCE